MMVRERQMDMDIVHQLRNRDAPWGWQASDEIVRLRAENERLRAALRRIAGGGEKYDSAAHLMRIAQDALAASVSEKE